MLRCEPAVGMFKAEMVSALQALCFWGHYPGLQPELLWGLSSEQGFSSFVFLSLKVSLVFRFLVAFPLLWQLVSCAAPVCYPHAKGLGA